MRIFLIGALIGAATQSVGQAVTFEEESALAREVLSSIQPTSIAENVEYCGVIGLNAAGKLVAAKPRRGAVDSCEMFTPRNIVVETASYHTHGGFSADYVNEIPSIDDIEGDMDDGIDGYIATPGGRFWYNDTEAEEIYQICGLGCLPSDPLFIQGSNGTVYSRYSYDELYELYSE